MAIQISKLESEIDKKSDEIGTFRNKLLVLDEAHKAAELDLRDIEKDIQLARSKEEGSTRRLDRLLKLESSTCPVCLRVVDAEHLDSVKHVIEDQVAEDKKSLSDLHKAVDVFEKKFASSHDRMAKIDTKLTKVERLAEGL